MLIYLCSLTHHTHIDTVLMRHISDNDFVFISIFFVLSFGQINKQMKKKLSSIGFMCCLLVESDWSSNAHNVVDYHK